MGRECRCLIGWPGAAIVRTMTEPVGRSVEEVEARSNEPEEDDDDDDDQGSSGSSDNSLMPEREVSYPQPMLGIILTTADLL